MFFEFGGAIKNKERQEATPILNSKCCAGTLLSRYFKCIYIYSGPEVGTAVEPGPPRHWLAWTELGLPLAGIENLSTAAALARLTKSYIMLCGRAGGGG